ncbi:MAG: alpha-L-fucosidase [Ignavibacteriales bacterium]|nr:alpha-L-fucosidase [Ignavibacteriales bacterium]
MIENPTNKRCSLVFYLCVMFFPCVEAQQPSNYAIIKPGESPEEIIHKAATVIPSPRQLSWQQMEFIAFVHFGMNTFMDREWGQGNEDPAVFNPTDLDARQWVKVIKDAGMKMLIVTAKHHDGFCLWPSKYTDHNVKNSPWKGGKGDVVSEVAQACREAGIKLGVYLSPWDRHEKSYGDSPTYNEHFRNQLRELLSNYGDIAEVWFDGACGEGPNGKRQEYDWQSYYKVIRELQPQAVIAIMGPDIRWVGTESGYGRETEWSVLPRVSQNLDAIAASSQQDPIAGAYVPGDLMGDDLGSRDKIKTAKSLVWYPAETDVSIRPGWFYHEGQDDLVKTPGKLVDIYYSSVGRNSVLLLNIPPDKRGRISGNDIKALKGLRKTLDQTFSTNLTTGARVIASNERLGHSGASSVDRDAKNYWTTEDGVESATLDIQLARTLTFNRALLQENITVGQRVEAFRLEAWTGKTWREIARGTTIGYKRLLRFPSMTAAKVRVVVERSRTSPTLSAFGLFKAPPNVVIEPYGGSFETETRVRLSTDTKGATVRYTLDGTDPTMRSAKYSTPIVLTRSAILKATAVIGGELCAEPVVARFIRCFSVKSAEFEKPFSPKYAGHGEATIMNGKRASLDLNDKEWLGFLGDDMIATVDLGQARTVSKITAGFLQQQGSWIFLPSAVTFFVSEDKTNWRDVGALKSPIEQTERVLTKDFTCAVDKIKTRYIRVAAKNVGVCPSWHPSAGEKAWLFTDEIFVE